MIPVVHEHYGRNLLQLVDLGLKGNIVARTVVEPALSSVNKYKVLIDAYMQRDIG